MAQYFPTKKEMCKGIKKVYQAAKGKKYNIAKRNSGPYQAWPVSVFYAQLQEGT